MEQSNRALSPTLAEAIDGLPVLSPVIARVGSVVANPDSSVAAIVAALKIDPILSGKVLKLANSAFVGIPRTISSLKNAVVLLGQKRVHSLVLAAGVGSVIRKQGELPFSPQEYWKHSTAVAAIGETIAKHLRRYEAIETDDVFSAGLLHDIGRMVLGCFFGRDVELVKSRAFADKVPLFERESAELSHSLAGATLADRWNFPPALKDAIEFHHMPAKAGPNARLASIVHLADILAHIMGAGTFAGEAIPHPAAEAQALVQLPPERLKVIAEETLQNEKKFESFVGFLA